MRLSKRLLAILLVLNGIVLLGQIWPAGAPPFARIVNIVFLVASFATFGYLLRETGSPRSDFSRPDE